MGDERRGIALYAVFLDQLFVLTRFTEFTGLLKLVLSWDV